MRTRTHQLYLIFLAVILISAFLFLRSNWGDVVAVRSRPGVSIHQEHETVTHEAGNSETDNLKDLKDAEDPKDATQVVLDHSVATSTRIPTPTPHVSRKPATPTTSPVYDRAIVMGRLHAEDTSWVTSELPEWQHHIYIVDDANSTSLHTPMNKGREAMPYLTYMIDNYHDLPSTIAFLHAHRSGYPLAWHNEGGENHDAVEMMHTLNIDYIQRSGYANLRCIHIPGCPDEIQPFRNPREGHRTAEHAMPDAWKGLFNNTDVPKRIGTPCCAQFAVSRDQVRTRPLEEYKRYRDWLMKTTLEDDVSGRVFEYLWHIIFGREPVHCPVLEQCYCDVYRQCG